MSQIVTEAQLQEASGFAQRSRLEQWLRANNIRYWRGRDGLLCTTTGLMEAAALGQHAAPPANGPAAPVRFANAQTP